MKNNKKSVFLKRLTLFLAVCLAVIPSLALLSSAEAASFFKKWTMSDDMSTIYGDGVPYHKIEDRGFSASNHKGYVFYNEIEDEYGHGTYSVTSTDENGSYVWLSSYEIYATEEGRQSFDELKSLSGASGYKMYDSNNYYADLDESVIDLIILDTKSATATSMDYASLGYRVKYDLVAVSGDGFVEYTFATVYLADGTWYYLDRASLSDEHYNDIGELNYRDGKVKVYPLKGATAAYILKAEDNLTYASYYYDLTYEEELYTERYIEENRAAVTVAVLIIAFLIFVFVAFILPLPVLVLGIVLPQIKKLGKPKYWYSLCVFALLWMLLTLLLLIVVALAVLI